MSELTITVSSEFEEYEIELTGGDDGFEAEITMDDSAEFDVDFSEIGAKGDPGEDGADGADGADGRNVTLGEYVYHAASTTADTAGDWRQYADIDGYYFQQCTVSNPAKGAGTWVTKFTTQA